MLMVVFGAGASYDSSTDYSPLSDVIVRTPVGTAFNQRAIRPPLASELFELRPIFADVAQKLPKCLIPIDNLRYLSPDVSVEQTLEGMRELAISYPEGKRQLVSIRFYLQWIISKCQAEWNAAIKSQTNYLALLRRIDQQRKGDTVCLVTFNYDTLLEEAFASLDKRFESLDDYVSSNDFKIIKLHGSVNWVREPTIPIQTDMADHVQVANDALKAADKMELSDKYHLVPEAERQQHIFSYMEISGEHGVVFPAIAIPLEKKTEYECPKEHVQALQECISRTDKLLIIGWKAAEENFVDLLSKGLEKEIPKMIVSRSKDSAEKIHNTLSNAGVDGAHWLFGEGGFTDEVRSGRIERFIGK